MAALGLQDVQKLVAANNLSKNFSNEFVTCLIWKECGFDPRKNAKTSAAGLMQIETGAISDVNKLPSRAGKPFTSADMSDNAKNIQCGTLYLDLRVKWAKGDITAGVNGFGTGAGYIDNILTCEACLKKPTGGTSCLLMIHP